MNSDEGEPERPLAQRIFTHWAGDLGIQDIDLAEDDEERRHALNHVEMADHEKRVGQLHIHADVAKEQACQAAMDEGEEKADGEQHRHAQMDVPAPERRSEEHTSELQSLMRISYAVFCLKKKKHQ